MGENHEVKGSKLQLKFIKNLETLFIKSVSKPS